MVEMPGAINGVVQNVLFPVTPESKWGKTPGTQVQQNENHRWGSRASMCIPMKPPGYTDLKPPGMVSSRRPLSSCHAGEVWVKRLPPTWFAFLLVAAVAAGWLALGQVGEVEIDDGLECFGCSATA